MAFGPVLIACDLSLYDHGRDDTCADPGHAKALESRRAGAPPWGTLIRRDDGDVAGWRDCLDTQPIHCGMTLELQSVIGKEDAYGSFAVKLPTGVPVRYDRSGEYVVLYASIGGHQFRCRAEPWMRFRWPERREV